LVDGPKLAALASRNADIGVCLRRLFSDELRDKLMASDRDRFGSFARDAGHN